MAKFIDVDFRDGTGPSALPPNDVARAFREAEDFAPVGRGAKFWAGMTGVDGAHHPGSVRGVQGGGRAGSGRRAGATVGRTRVVHVESATTGKFFKVRSDRETREVERGEARACSRLPPKSCRFWMATWRKQLLIWCGNSCVIP